MGRAERALRALVAGLTEPSLPAALGALAIAASLWVGAATQITWDSVVAGWWLTSPTDDYAALSASCLRAQRAPLPALPVMLIGASASREALSEPRSLALQLGNKLRLAPDEVAVHALLAGDLRPVEMLALVDCVPARFDGLVVLEVSPQALSAPTEEIWRLLHTPRIALRSEALRAWATSQGEESRAPTGVPLLDAPGFFLARPEALAHLRSMHPIQPLFHQIDFVADPDMEVWEQRIAPRLDSWVEGYDAHSALHLELYAALIAQLRARGAVVVVLDAPRNPDAVARARADPAVRAQLQRYDADLVELTEKSGAIWARPMEALALDGSAFKDHSHIDDRRAREAWTKALARLLTTALREARWTPTRAPSGAPAPSELPPTPFGARSPRPSGGAP